jgi:drug/metabolite transporter (DMT)-like permease
VTNPLLRPSVLGLMTAHVIINSCGYIIVKAGLGEFTPLAFGFWRFVFGLGGLFLLIAWRRTWPRVEKKDWPRFLLLAALAVPTNQLLYLTGMRDSVPSHASLIYASTAGIAILLSTAVGYERLRAVRVVAIAFALVGVALVVSESPTPILGTEKFTGDALIIVSMLAWASYTVLVKPLITKYGTLSATNVVLMAGSLMGLPFLLLPALAQDYSVVSWRGWLGTAYTGIFITVISYTLWAAMLKRIDPSQVAIVTTPQPVVTTALSILILGESPGAGVITGGVLVIGGVIMMQVKGKRKKDEDKR